MQGGVPLQKLVEVALKSTLAEEGIIFDVRLSSKAKKISHFSLPSLLSQSEASRAPKMPSLYEISIPVFIRALNNLSAILSKGSDYADEK